MFRKLFCAFIVGVLLIMSACGSSGETGKGTENASAVEQGAPVDTVKGENNAAPTSVSAAPDVVPEVTDEGQGNAPAEITEEEAKRIALEDAGVSEDHVIQIRVYLDAPEKEYEVEFYVDDKEYDYDISLTDGSIRSKDMDIEDDFLASPQEIPGEVIITEEEAINIFLEKVPGASREDVMIVLERDDGGKLIYEGKLRYNGREYEIEIDGETGTVTEWDEDSAYD